MKYQLKIRILFLLVNLMVVSALPAFGSELTEHFPAPQVVEPQQATPSTPRIPVSEDPSDSLAPWQQSLAGATPTPTATAIPTETPIVEPSATAPATTQVINLNRYYVPEEVNPSEELHPVRIQIPALGVDALVELVGKDATGRMDVPVDVDSVAWYAYGTVPGEIGNAVMAGHLDRIGGTPAVFYDLEKLDVGDRIIVDMSDSSTLTFEMRSSADYDYYDAPLNDIFGFDIRSDLNLITCRGVWDRGERTYTQRHVVYATLIP